MSTRATPRFTQQLGALVAKDLRSELRTREILTTTLLFPLILLLVFRFAFEVGDTVGVKAAAPGVIWASALLSSILSLTRSFASEREDDRIHGLLLAPVDRGTIYLAKLFANIVFLFLVEAVTLAAFGLFFAIDLAPALPSLLPVIALGTVGISAVGTLFSAMAVNTRARESLLPLLLFPVLTPILLAVLEYTRVGLAASGEAIGGHWLGSLIAFDVIFVAAGWMLFEYVVEE
jgi:heme exporter protein B